MNFKPQCKEQSDLYEQMARVLRMCKEAGFDRPWECVKVDGRTKDQECNFCYNVGSYEFAIAIVEGRPVFRDSELFNAKGNRLLVTSPKIFKNYEGKDSLYTYMNGWPDDAPTPIAELYWNPPKPKTIEINGVKVKAPLSVEGSDDAEHPERHGVFITFKYYDDAEAFKDAMEGKK